MIYYFTPTTLDKNLAQCYDQYMSLINDDDWAVMIDRDVFFLQHNYMHIINDAITRHPDTGMFTCYTNRVGDLRQCFKEIINANPNIIDHKKLADSINDRSVTQLKAPISGMLMIIKKSTWSNLKVTKSGFLGVDNNIANEVERIGKKILRINGLYVFHYYRLKEGISNKNHLK